MERKLGNIKYFVGIDIAKATFNYCVRYGGGQVINGKTANQLESIHEFLSMLKQIPGCQVSNVIFGMEVTGVYGNVLIEALSKLKAKFVVEPALRIKNSLGIIRGKNDKLDASRIARYLIKNLHELKLWVPKRKIIQEMNSLSTLRQRIIKIQGMMTVPLKEDKEFINEPILKVNNELCNPTLTELKKLITNIDTHLKQLWTQDEQCKRLMQIMLSVTGIGPVTALQILIHTNEFKSITNPRAFASYCGVAPFEYGSGTSVKKAPRVSHYANKKIKSLLHTGVIVLITHDPDTKAYYKRRVEVDKKNKMSTINAIKFKLICRIFACVRGDRLYDRNYISAQME